VKAQEEAPYRLGCPTHKVIRNYSKTRFGELAHAASTLLEQIQATNISGDDFQHRSLWDEFCRDVQNGERASGQIAFDASVHSILNSIVETIGNAEAVLLTIGARWHLGEEQDEAGDIVAVPDLIRRNLYDAIETLAILRDMSEFESDKGPWPIRVEDLAPLECLLGAVRSMASLARCGDDFVALGEACLAIESILASERFDVNVGLTVGFRRGESDFEEGLMAVLKISPDQIVLDELNTTYTSERGSDHFTRIYATLERGGGFDCSGITDWISRIEELQGFDDVKLGTMRGHVL